MINGYDELSKKYDKMITINDIVHDISGGARLYSAGLTTSEAYVGLVEQNVGQNVYEKYYKLEATYSELYSLTNMYIEEKREYNKIVSDIKAVVANIQTKEKDILQLEDKRKALINKEHTSPQEDLEIKRISSDLYTKKRELEDDIKKRKELEDQCREKEIQCAADLTRINRLKEKLIKAIEEVNKMEDAFGLFRDKKFKQSIEQDFIDACLVPGEERKEADLRTVANSKFLMMKLETVYLTRVKEYAQNLHQELSVTEGAKELIDFKMPKHVQAQNLQLKGLRYLSVDFLESSDAVLNDTVIAQFYQYVYKQTVKSEFGAYPTEELTNLPKVAMQQFGIPKSYNGSVASKITALLKGSKTTFSVECLNDIFMGSDKLVEAQKLLREAMNEYSANV